MRSQWFEYKEKAIELRKQGFSYGEITAALSIPKSTLSHWLRSIELTDNQKARLNDNYGKGLIKARAKASQWHKEQKEIRIQRAKKEAKEVLDNIALDENIVELALAMLYLGEGAKTGTTAIGNSNPLVLKFFLTLLVSKYRLEISKIRFDLHIRYDQDPDEVKSYWSKTLGIPIEQFKYVVADKRTKGVPSYPDYRGVCIINCGNIAIQRKLIALYNQFCEKIIDEWAVSSVG